MDSFIYALVLTPALTERPYPAPALSLRNIAAPAKAKVGTLRVEVRSNPLTVVVTNAGRPFRDACLSRR